jgi:hypothetical protein
VRSRAEVGGFWPRRFELVFTAGVLIHVAAGAAGRHDGLHHRARARSTILAVEYEAANEREIDYRGHAARLWRRPFGLQYEAMGLELESSGELGEGRRLRRLLVLALEEAA